MCVYRTDREMKIKQTKKETNTERTKKKIDDNDHTLSKRRKKEQHTHTYTPGATHTGDERKIHDGTYSTNFVCVLHIIYRVYVYVVSVVVISGWWMNSEYAIWICAPSEVIVLYIGHGKAHTEKHSATRANANEKERKKEEKHISKRTKRASECDRMHGRTNQMKMKKKKTNVEEMKKKKKSRHKKLYVYDRLSYLFV